MSRVHFLNVNEGDCNIIEHESGRISVLDVCCARTDFEESNPLNEDFSIKSIRGNFNQKENPENPIRYIQQKSISHIFRYIQTHPDMDHMDGIKDLFDKFQISNFWDSDNKKEMAKDCCYGKYREEDWEFYKKIRESKGTPTVLHLVDENTGKYYQDDGLKILAPSTELVAEANRTKDYNDASYVILYSSHNKKIIFSGDSAEKTWNYILEKYHEQVKNIDVLVAPHHGRKTGGNDDYLDVLNPKLTLFGNARSKDLDYNSWNNRRLYFITNNQAGNIILNVENEIEVYITNKAFADKYGGRWCEALGGYYIKSL